MRLGFEFYFSHFLLSKRTPTQAWIPVSVSQLKLLAWILLLKYEKIGLKLQPQYQQLNFLKENETLRKVRVQFCGYFLYGSIVQQIKYKKDKFAISVSELKISNFISLLRFPAYPSSLDDRFGVQLAKSRLKRCLN